MDLSSAIIASSSPRSICLWARARCQMRRRPRKQTKRRRRQHTAGRQQREGAARHRSVPGHMHASLDGDRAPVKDDVISHHTGEGGPCCPIDWRPAANDGSVPSMDGSSELGERASEGRRGRSRVRAFSGPGLTCDRGTAAHHPLGLWGL
jgi:hypothetical protein